MHDAVNIHTTVFNVHQCPHSSRFNKQRDDRMTDNLYIKRKQSPNTAKFKEAVRIDGNDKCRITVTDESVDRLVTQLPPPWSIIKHYHQGENQNVFIDVSSCLNISELARVSLQRLQTNSNQHYFELVPQTDSNQRQVKLTRSICVACSSLA
jgi:hypothetical protein